MIVGGGGDKLKFIEQNYIEMCLIREYYFYYICFVYFGLGT